MIIEEMIPSKKLLIITSLNLFFSFISCESISYQFERFLIVPENIPTAPTEILQVTYSDKYEAHLGNEIPPQVVSTPPKLNWKAISKQYYLFTMIDLDYPCPEMPQFFHWVIGNIPGNDLSKGQLLVKYISPQPPPEDGSHRYTFLIFEQPGFVYYKQNLFQSEECKHPSLQEALKYYNIDNRPLAGNFYLSKRK